MSLKFAGKKSFQIIAARSPNFTKSTHCSNGHRYTIENTGFTLHKTPTGSVHKYRYCKACDKARKKR